MIIILLGAPGSGKGTQAEYICPKYNLFPVSTGDLLRERKKADDDIARNINALMSEGKLIPDDTINLLVSEMLDAKLASSDQRGLLFDGYPRTVEQAKFLNEALKKHNKKIDGALLFQIDENIIVDRITSRRVDRKTGKIYNLKTLPPPAGGDYDLYQREDDTEEVIKKRLAVYKEQTEPLIDFYTKQGVIFNVDAAAERSETEKEVSDILGKF
ncbi:MAG: adenylate kinase [Ignavibacteria bacterium]|jgi:adenylate kinase|nr:adenylate kinase [Ignavibacteria bacterium]